MEAPLFIREIAFVNNDGGINFSRPQGIKGLLKRADRDNLRSKIGADQFENEIGSGRKTGD